MMGSGFGDAVGKVFATSLLLVAVVVFAAGFVCGYGCHAGKAKYRVHIERVSAP